jgi:hypothetical protein
MFRFSKAKILSAIFLTHNFVNLNREYRFGKEPTSWACVNIVGVDNVLKNMISSLFTRRKLVCD